MMKNFPFWKTKASASNPTPYIFLQSKKILKLMTSNKEILKQHKGQVHHFYAVRSYHHLHFPEAKAGLRIDRGRSQDRALL